MIVTGHFRTDLARLRLVAEDDAANFALARKAAAAMVGEARIMVAEEPDPVEIRGQSQQHLARLLRQAVAAEAIMEAVAETEKPRCAGCRNLIGQCGERRLAVVGWQELAEAREPARLFKM